MYVQDVMNACKCKEEQKPCSSTNDVHCIKTVDDMYNVVAIALLWDACLQP